MYVCVCVCMHTRVCVNIRGDVSTKYTVKVGGHDIIIYVQLLPLL